jgi:hypothetical protein
MAPAADGDVVTAVYGIGAQLSAIYAAQVRLEAALLAAAGTAAAGSELAVAVAVASDAVMRVAASPVKQAGDVIGAVLRLVPPPPRVRHLQVVRAAGG